MPLKNRSDYPEEVLFPESEFLEIGIRSNGEKIIQVGEEGGAPLVAFARTNNPISENLYIIELWSLAKFSQDENDCKFYDKPKRIYQPENTQVIQKFQLPKQGEFALNLPLNAQILTIQLQNNEPCLWALFNSKERPITWEFIWIRTGEKINYDNLKYIATLQLDMGKKVIHLFQKN